jgi:molybdopterin molybdotransferase
VTGLSLDPIPVEQLQDRIAETMSVLPARELPLAQARGLVLAEDVVAGVALPPFANSAMDGYAVHLADVTRATAAAPVTLPVVGEIGAGNAGVRSIEPGVAAKIMTGAPVPDGCDTVVPYEWTDRGASVVTISRAPGPGQHIRVAGEDVAVGDHLLTAGTRLSARQLGLIAALGRAGVVAHPRPKVVVISTGSELCEPGTPLADDSIYDANSYLIAASAEAAGATVRRVGIVPDNASGFRTALHAEIADADLVVTSGGVSQGDFDVVKEALIANGSMWFGPVAMQPGKPQGFGLVDGVPIFTLPGNPVSSYISFEVFVVPAIRQMMGLAPRHRPRVSAALTRGVTSPPQRRQFLRGEYSGPIGSGADAGDIARVTPVGGPGSHLLGSLAHANALIVIPEDTTAMAEGEIVQVLALDVDF